ncbi:STAS domain-containing protein [Streptomyces sp. NPDC056132]|uniref:STAS domain-containing protein n=1 Tax=Streptomyces sp. NPDC056132 TaxID=3345722 RepID=UPI0035DB969D
MRPGRDPVHPRPGHHCPPSHGHPPPPLANAPLRGGARGHVWRLGRGVDGREVPAEILPWCLWNEPVGEPLTPAEVEATAVEDCLVARVRGDLDYLTLPELRPQFDELLELRESSIVLDLSQVTFCDSVDLDLLLHLRRRADETGTVLMLADVPRPLLGLFAMTGVDRLLQTYDSVTSAIATRSR